MAYVIGKKVALLLLSSVLPCAAGVFDGEDLQKDMASVSAAQEMISDMQSLVRLNEGIQRAIDQNRVNGLQGLIDQYVHEAALIKQKNPTFRENKAEQYTGDLARLIAQNKAVAKKEIEDLFEILKKSLRTAKPGILPADFMTNLQEMAKLLQASPEIIDDELRKKIKPLQYYGQLPQLLGDLNRTRENVRKKSLEDLSDKEKLKLFEQAVATFDEMIGQLTHVCAKSGSICAV